jgi:hypothetical protein
MISNIRNHFFPIVRNHGNHQKSMETLETKEIKKSVCSPWFLVGNYRYFGADTGTGSIVTKHRRFWYGTGLGAACFGTIGTELSVPVPRWHENLGTWPVPIGTKNEKLDESRRAPNPYRLKLDWTLQFGACLDESWVPSIEIVKRFVNAYIKTVCTHRVLFSLALQSLYFLFTRGDYNLKSTLHYRLAASG